MPSNHVHHTRLHTGRGHSNLFRLSRLHRLLMLAAVTAALPTGQALANATQDGYGNEVVTEAQTGGAYVCSNSVPPAATFCADNPFVVNAGAAIPPFVFLDPRGLVNNQAVDIYYVANNASDISYAVSSDEIGVLEGNEISGFSLVDPDYSGNGGFYRNYAANANFTVAGGANLYLIANNNIGSIINASGEDTYVLIKKNLTSNAQIGNAGGSTMVIDGNNAGGATITNAGDSQMVIRHNDAEGVTFNINGGEVDFYGNTIEQGIFTIAAGAIVRIADCSAALDCEDDRVNTISGSGDFSNSGVMHVSGGVDLTGKTIDNEAGGIIYFNGTDLESGAFSNRGSIVMDTGVNRMNGSIAGDEEGTVQINSGATLALTDGGVASSNTFMANGGTLQLSLDLSTQTTVPVSFGRSQFADVTSGPVTIALSFTGNVSQQVNPVDIPLITIDGGAAASAPGIFQMAPTTRNGWTYSLMRDEGTGNWVLQREVAAVKPVPTMGHFSLVLLTLLAGLFGVKQLRRPHEKQA